MGAPIRFNGPVYAALRQNTPAVLTHVSAEEAGGLRAVVNNVHSNAQLRRTQAGAQANSAAGSIFTGPFAHASPAVTWAVAFGSLLLHTINNWTSLSANAGQVVSLIAMVTTAAHATVVYWRHNRQSTLAQQRTDQFVHAQAIYSKSKFLMKSSNMANECLKTNPPANLPLIFPNFEAHMNTRKAGVVPNDLAADWTTIGTIIRLPPDDPQHTHIPILIQDSVLPRIKEYAADLHKELIKSGYVPPDDPPPENPQQVPQVVVHGGQGAAGQP